MKKILVLSLILITSQCFSLSTNVPMPEKVVIGVLQYSQSNNVEDNRKKASSFIIEAAQRGAKIILLPELYNSIYFCQEENISHFDLAEKLDGPSYELFSNLAKKLNVVLLIPFFEKRSLGIYHNTVIVINNDGKSLGIYRKMHIPDDPFYYEKFYFTPGDLGFKTFNTSYGPIGTLICWDQWYPEAARITSLMGAICLFYPTAIGWHPKEKELYGKVQKDAWMIIQRSHAIANGVYVACANRVGLEKFVENTDGIEFWGSSFICDPQGVILAQASENKEEILLAEINLSEIETFRRNWPFYRDRRIDAYSPITQRFIE